jgi:CRISPR system Cascade subunit CasE
MHLSKLVVDATDGQTGRTLAEPYLLHQAIMAGFAPDRRGDTRVLFRLEPERPRGRTVLLVQSEAEPEWDRVFDRFFGERIWAEVKELRLALAPEQRLRFRLRANPTVRKRFPDLAGKSLRIGIYGDNETTAEEKLRAWLDRKLDQAGAVSNDYRVIDEGRVCGWASHGGVRRRLEFQSVLFEGTLIARDPQTLQGAIRQGIGSGKGFGFGLLSLAPAC